MKATELMVGDWVIVKGVPTKIHDIDEMDGINREWIAGCEDGGCICYEDIQPILLTPEILEKNGFEYIKRKVFYPNYSSGNEVESEYMYCKGLHCSFDIIHGYLMFNSNIDLCNIRMVVTYVHQLQHVLKLCGIDKEIIV